MQLSPSLTSAAFPRSPPRPLSLLRPCPGTTTTGPLASTTTGRLVIHGTLEAGPNPGGRPFLSLWLDLVPQSRRLPDPASTSAPAVPFAFPFAGQRHFPFAFLRHRPVCAHVLFYPDSSALQDADAKPSGGLQGLGHVHTRCVVAICAVLSGPELEPAQL